MNKHEWVLAFDSTAWEKVGHDVGDNSCFWKPARIVGRHGYHVHVIFIDSRSNSRGHMLTGIMPITDDWQKRIEVFEAEGDDCSKERRAFDVRLKIDLKKYDLNIKGYRDALYKHHFEQVGGCDNTYYATLVTALLEMLEKNND